MDMEQSKEIVLEWKAKIKKERHEQKSFNDMLLRGV